MNWTSGRRGAMRDGGAIGARFLAGLRKKGEDVVPLGLGDGEGAECFANGVPSAEAAGDGGKGVGAVAAIFPGGGRALEFAGDGGPVGQEGGVVDALVVLVEMEAGGAQEGVPGGEMGVDVAHRDAGSGAEECLEPDAPAAGGLDRGADGVEEGRFIGGRLGFSSGHWQSESESGMAEGRGRPRCDEGRSLMPRGIFARKKYGSAGIPDRADRDARAPPSRSRGLPRNFFRPARRSGRRAVTCGGSS